MRFVKAARYLSIVLMILSLSPGVFAQSGLAGKWKLNKKESDDPKEKFKAAMGHNRGDHGNGGHWGGAGGGHHSGGGMYGGGHRSGENHMEDAMKAAEELTIVYEAPEFKVTDKNGKTRTYYTDDRESEIETMNGRTMKAKATGSDQDISIETESSDGDRKMTQEYYLGPTNVNRLYVKMTMKPMMSDETITITRTYDRVSAGDEKSQ
jgi:hypothetical protein